MKHYAILTTIKTTGLDVNTDSIIELSMACVDLNNQCEFIHKPFKHNLSWNKNKKHEICIPAVLKDNFTEKDVDGFEDPNEVVKQFLTWVEELKQLLNVNTFWFCSFNEFTYKFFKNFLFDYLGTSEYFYNLFYTNDLRLQDMSVIKIIQEFDITREFKKTRNNLYSVFCPTESNTKSNFGKDYFILKHIFNTNANKNSTNKS